MNNELADDSRKDWARLLYTEHDTGIKDVALTVGVDEVCVRHWVNTLGWNGIKRSLLTSRNAQLQHMYTALEILNSKINSDQEKSVKDIDLYIKYTAAIKNLEGDISIAMIIQVGALFINWLRRKDMELTRSIATQFDDFINSKLSAID